MSRYIDADALKIPSEEIIAKMIINSAPSIDIVRCKECKHSEESLVSGSVYCNEMDRAISENGFCHKGERKESE